MSRGHYLQKGGAAAGGTACICCEEVTELNIRHFFNEVITKVKETAFLLNIGSHGDLPLDDKEWSYDNISSSSDYGEYFVGAGLLALREKIISAKMLIKEFNIDKENEKKAAKTIKALNKTKIVSKINRFGISETIVTLSEYKQILMKIENKCNRDKAEEERVMQEKDRKKKVAAEEEKKKKAEDEKKRQYFTNSMNKYLSKTSSSKNNSASGDDPILELTIEKGKPRVCKKELDDEREL